MKKLIISNILLISTLLSFAQLKHALRDDFGRHVIGRGFVVVTNDGSFNSDDYVRMARLGANYQVVRLEPGKLGDLPGGAGLKEDYLLKLDSLVELGKNVGIKTVFKMTAYGLRDFSWEKFWRNENNINETYIETWKVVWNRYKNENAVSGYDLVNEPRKLEMEISYEELTKDFLLPMYKRLIDEAHKINPDKQCLVQTIFMNKGEKVDGNQYFEIKHPINRKNVMFAPHIYQQKKELLEPSLLRFEKESKVLDAPVFIGEWGFPTFESTDANMTGNLGQLNYMDFYIRTAELFDSLGFNTIKAWFSGNPVMQNFLPGGKSTWAIFSDKNAVGSTERKYITDIIARPYPQAIAGDLNAFRYNFATRSLDISITTDNSKGASHIFIGANRHYPDGFSVVINDSLVLCHNPLKTVGLEVVKNEGSGNPADFVWDEYYQRLIIQKWPEDKANVQVQIIPGINN